MDRAKQGSAITVQHSTWLDDGSVVDSSKRDAPLTLKLGDRTLFEPVEQALVGLCVGERATVRVEAAQAFGPHSPELVMVLDRADLPTDEEPRVGEKLGTHAPDRSMVQLLVTKIEGSSITLDGNHPLAGKPLTVEVQVLSLA